MLEIIADMSDNILKVGFNIIRENIKNDNLEGRFMVFDNLSSGFNDFTPVVVTGYPVRINTITMIAFCTEGYIKLNLGLKEMTISKNQLYVTLPEQIIQTTEVSPDFKAGFIVFERNFFNFQDDFMKAIAIHNSLIENSSLNLSEHEMNEYITIFGMIKDKIRDADNKYRMQIIRNYCRITFYNIYNLIMNAQKEQNYDSPKSNDARIYERFIKSVEKNYREKHSVNDYADELCLTPKYLSTTIKQASGKHAAEWIREYIILKAKALLKSTKMSLQDIAEELNFSSPSHFGRFFKRYTGHTPKEYQRL